MEAIKLEPQRGETRSRGAFGCTEVGGACRVGCRMCEPRIGVSNSTRGGKRKRELETSGFAVTFVVEP